MILIADDDNFVRRILRDFFLRQGHSVELVSSGAEALETARLRNYALLLLDFEMGSPTGLEVLQNLRASGIDTPAILMAGSLNVFGLEETLSLTGLSYLKKPFSPSELERVVEGAMRKPERPLPPLSADSTN